MDSPDKTPFSKMPASALNAAKTQHVLIVDDDSALLYLLQRVLRNAGYTVAVAESGSAGLRLFREQAWDLIILDRAMPEMGGEELAKIMRVHTPNIPLVMITGLIDLVARRELFNAVLRKPFS